MPKGVSKVMKPFIFLNVTAMVTSVAFGRKNFNVSFPSSLLNVS